MLKLLLLHQSFENIIKILQMALQYGCVDDIKTVQFTNKILVGIYYPDGNRTAVELQ